MCSVHLYEEEWMEQHLERRQRLLRSGHKLTRHLLKGVMGSSRPFHTDEILAKRRYVWGGIDLITAWPSLEVKDL